MAPLIRYPVQQHAFVVADLDEAMPRWTETTGAGPWWVSRGHRGRDHRYRGRPVDHVLHYAFAGTGPTHVQLVQQDDDTPSIYREVFGAGEEGFHHLAVLVPEAEMAAEVARFEAAGFAVADTLWSYVPVAYVDCREAIGCFVELHGENQEIRDLFALFRDSHADWDGVTDPVRVRSRSSSA
ncbi:VOC family protein [Blastococcus sp. SYSU D00669]